MGRRIKEPPHSEFASRSGQGAASTSTTFTRGDEKLTGAITNRSSSSSSSSTRSLAIRRPSVEGEASPRSDAVGMTVDAPAAAAPDAGAAKRGTVKRRANGFASGRESKTEEGLPDADQRQRQDSHSPSGGAVHDGRLDQKTKSSFNQISRASASISHSSSSSGTDASRSGVSRGGGGGRDASASNTGLRPAIEAAAAALTAASAATSSTHSSPKSSMNSPVSNAAEDGESASSSSIVRDLDDIHGSSTNGTRATDHMASRKQLFDPVSHATSDETSISSESSALPGDSPAANERVASGTAAGTARNVPATHRPSSSKPLATSNDAAPLPAANGVKSTMAKATNASQDEEAGAREQEKPRSSVDAPGRPASPTPRILPRVNKLHLRQRYSVFGGKAGTVDAFARARGLAKDLQPLESKRAAAELGGLLRQAVLGDWCTCAMPLRMPPRWKVEERAEWDAWTASEGVTKLEAMRIFTLAVTELYRQKHELCTEGNGSVPSPTGDSYAFNFNPTFGRNGLRNDSRQPNRRRQSTGSVHCSTGGVDVGSGSDCNGGRLAGAASVGDGVPNSRTSETLRDKAQAVTSLFDANNARGYGANVQYAAGQEAVTAASAAVAGVARLASGTVVDNYRRTGVPEAGRDHTNGRAASRSRIDFAESDRGVNGGVKESEDVGGGSGSQRSSDISDASDDRTIPGALAGNGSGTNDRRAVVKGATTAAGEEGPSKAGVLYKKREFFPGWRPRTFLLDRQQRLLRYYLPNSARPRGSISLNGCSVELATPASSSGGGRMRGEGGGPDGRQLFRLRLIAGHPSDRSNRNVVGGGSIASSSSSSRSGRVRGNGGNAAAAVIGSGKSYTLAATSYGEAQAWVDAIRAAAVYSASSSSSSSSSPASRGQERAKRSSDRSARNSSPRGGGDSRGRSFSPLNARRNRDGSDNSSISSNGSSISVSSGSRSSREGEPSFRRAGDGRRRDPNGRGGARRGSGSQDGRGASNPAAVTAATAGRTGGHRDGGRSTSLGRGPPRVMRSRRVSTRSGAAQAAASNGGSAIAPRGSGRTWVRQSSAAPVATEEDGMVAVKTPVLYMVGTALGWPVGLMAIACFASCMWQALGAMGLACVVMVGVGTAKVPSRTAKKSRNRRISVPADAGANGGRSKSASMPARFGRDRENAPMITGAAGYSVSFLVDVQALQVELDRLRRIAKEGVSGDSGTRSVLSPTPASSTAIRSTNGNRSAVADRGAADPHDFGDDATNQRPSTTEDEAATVTVLHLVIKAAASVVLERAKSRPSSSYGGRVGLARFTRIACVASGTTNSNASMEGSSSTYVNGNGSEIVVVEGAERKSATSIASEIFARGRAASVVDTAQAASISSVKRQGSDHLSSPRGIGRNEPAGVPLLHEDGVRQLIDAVGNVEGDDHELGDGPWRPEIHEDNRVPLVHPHDVPGLIQSLASVSEPGAMGKGLRLPRATPLCNGVRGNRGGVTSVWRRPGWPRDHRQEADCLVEIKPAAGTGDDNPYTDSNAIRRQEQQEQQEQQERSDKYLVATSAGDECPTSGTAGGTDADRPTLHVTALFTPQAGNLATPVQVTVGRVSALIREGDTRGGGGKGGEPTRGDPLIVLEISVVGAEVVGAEGTVEFARDLRRRLLAA